MPTGRDEFIDMLGGGLGSYVWQVNHESEEEMGAELNVQRTAPVSGVGFVRQEGEPSPLLLRWKGTILHRNQHQKMWAFFDACRGFNGPKRTIRVTDFSGAQFEVFITAFNPIRVRAQKNPKGANDIERQYYWTYDITMEVVTVIANWP